MALLPEEPAGTVATLTAGSVYVAASMTGQPGDVLEFGLLPDLPGARLYLQEDCLVLPEKRVLRGEVRALSELHLRSALDLFMRHVTVEAALREAVLETRAERRAPASVKSAEAAGALARDLYDAGRRVRLSGCWSPSPASADVALGVRGLEGELERFLLEHPAWKVIR